jgi:hypothetical protein
MMLTNYFKIKSLGVSVTSDVNQGSDELGLSSLYLLQKADNLLEMIMISAINQVTALLALFIRALIKSFC